MPVIRPEDLDPFATIDLAKAEAMIEDAMADASRVAPCITDPDLSPEKVAQFKSILRAAILRWNEAGSGAYTQQTAGPYNVSVDTRTPRRGMFWPSELDALRGICKEEGTSRAAFSIDTAPLRGSAHLPWCSVNFGAVYCSCGVDIAGEPIYELG